MVERTVYRYRTGVAWRRLPAEFDPELAVRERHRRYAGDGMWDCTGSRALVCSMQSLGREGLSSVSHRAQAVQA